MAKLESLARTNMHFDHLKKYNLPLYAGGCFIDNNNFTENSTLKSIYDLNYCVKNLHIV